MEKAQGLGLSACVMAISGAWRPGLALSVL